MLAVEEVPKREGEIGREEQGEEEIEDNEIEERYAYHHLQKS